MRRRDRYRELIGEIVAATGQDRRRVAPRQEDSRHPRPATVGVIAGRRKDAGARVPAIG